MATPNSTTFDHHTWIAALAIVSMDATRPFAEDIGLPVARDDKFLGALRESIVEVRRKGDSGTFAEAQRALIVRCLERVAADRGSRARELLIWWVSNIFVFDTAVNRRVSDWDDFVYRYPTFGPRAPRHLVQKLSQIIDAHVTWIDEFHPRLDAIERQAPSRWDAQVLVNRWQWDPEFDHVAFICLTAHRYRTILMLSNIQRLLSPADLEELSSAAIEFVIRDDTAGRFNWRLEPLTTLPEVRLSLPSW